LPKYLVVPLGSVLITAPCGVQMTDSEQPFQEKLALQMALRKIENAFEACSQFEGADKAMLYEEIKKRLFQHIPSGPAEVLATGKKTPPRFSDRLLELASTAPTNDIRQFLVSLAEFCEAKPDTPSLSP
jgi:hypothetical protein